jgi:hypothetical protein
MNNLIEIRTIKKNQGDTFLSSESWNKQMEINKFWTVDCTKEGRS